MPMPIALPPDAFLSATLGLLAAFATVLPAQEDTVIVCQKGAKLEVRMRCRAVATAAERDWLQIELDNKTDAPLPIAGFTWRIDWAEITDAAGKLRGTSSGLSNGHDRDVFRRERPLNPIVLAPGITRITAPVSDYATALLGVAEAELVVTPHVVALAFLAGETVTEAGGQGPVFTFRWLPPDADGVKRMRATLADLLRTQQPPIGSLYLIGMLLKRPDVGGTLPIEDLLALYAPTPHREAFAPWAMVLPHLDAQFATERKLLDWVLQRLRGDDATILSDLHHMPRVWRADFLPELLRRSRASTPEEAPPSRTSVLWLLEQRGAPHRGDGAACAELAAPSVPELGLATPANVETQPQGDGGPIRYRIHGALMQLGQARDASHLDLVAVWLACKARIYGDIPMYGRPMSVPPDPERLCDTACDAALRLLGEDLAADYKRHAGDGTRSSEAEIRDRQIAALQERLRSRR